MSDLKRQDNSEERSNSAATGTNTSFAQGLAYLGFGLFLIGPAGLVWHEFGMLAPTFDPVSVSNYMAYGLFLVMAAGVMAMTTSPGMVELFRTFDDAVDWLRDYLGRESR
jgi:hypothetical protein